MVAPARDVRGAPSTPAHRSGSGTDSEAGPGARRAAAVRPRRGSVLGLFAGYAVGRLSAGTVAFTLLLAGRQVSGGLVVGGLAVAGYTGAVALVGPLLGRRMDARGSRRVLLKVSAAYAVGLLLTAVVAGAGGWALVTAATITGAVLPPLGPVLRSAVTREFRDPAERSRVLSAEAMVMETICLVGPLVVTVCAVASPRLALVVTAATSVIGTAVVVRSPWLRDVKETSNTRRQSRQRAALRPRVIAILGLVLIVTGVVSAVEVGLVAYAGPGRTWLSGVLIAVLAGGSLIGGLLSTVRRLPGSTVARLAVLLGVLIVGLLVLAVSSSVTVTVVALALSSFAVAPTVATAAAALGDVADGEQLTETFAWAASANFVGIAVWTAAAGWLAQHLGAPAVFWLGCASLALGLVLLAALRSPPGRAR